MREAVRYCLREHSQPFSVADFEQAYKSLPHASRALPQLGHGAPAQHDDNLEWLAALKRMTSTKSAILRTEANIAAGRWTDEQEHAFQRHLATCGLDRPATEPYHTPGSARACAYPGCASGGTMGATTNGGKTWYCHRHFRA